MAAKHIQGFNILPLYFTSDSTSYHELFMREHSGRNFEEDKPAGRTLFIINVPPYATHDSLKRVFTEAGKVKSIILQKSVSDSDGSKCGFKVGYVIFEKRDGLVKSLELKKLAPLSTKEHPVLCGFSKWIKEYNKSICKPEKLEEEVKRSIVKYEKNEQKEKSASTTEVDDEGWTVVTKKGRNPGLARKESVENKLIQKNKQQSLKKELKNFYTFQVKEQKMRNIAALRKNFEASKEKVNLMKKMRHFKPY